MNISIYQFKLFIDLLREKNFSRVARLNYCTQPGVTQQIKLLEEKLNVQLFERTRQGVIPTQAANEIEPLVQSMLDTCENIEEYAKNMSGKPVGNLRIATVYSVGIYELSKHLKEFIRLYPLIHLHLEYQNFEAIYEMIEQKKIDFGITAYPKESKNIGFHILKSDRLVVIAYPTHPLATRKWITAKDLENQKFIAFSDHLPTHHAISNFLSQQGVRVKICMTNDHIETLKNAVEIGMGISMVPEGTVLEEIQTGSLKAIPFKKEEILRPIGILYHKGKKISSAGQLFLDLLLKKRNH